jgi:predicted ATPase
MSELILDSLEIKGFRAFRHLTIEKLGRVNLIVGKNSVGKTAILEALRIYAERGVLEVMQEVLAARNENSVFSAPDENDLPTGEWVSAFGNLFYARPNFFLANVKISIGPIHNEEGELRIARKSYSQLMNVQYADNADGDIKEETLETLLPAVEVRLGSRRILYRLLTDFKHFPTPVLPPIDNLFIPIGGLTSHQCANLWDKVALTDAEENIIDTLHLIAPEVRRLNLLGYSDSDRNQPIIPKVRVAGSDKPVPLSSLGEGMNRLFGLSLALANTSNGFLLVDEIETGLHYSVQPDMWRLIFETAKRLNVQVFATTHSYDCVRAFEKVALQHPEEGVVVRLYRDKNGDVKQTLYDEDDLAVVAEQNIEVR